MELEGIILKPGERWSESTLKSIAGTALGKPVKYSSEPEAPVVGTVTDSEYKDGEGVHCRIEIQDDDIAEMFRTDAVNPAPALLMDKDVGEESAQFDSVFATPTPDDDVGEFEEVGDCTCDSHENASCHLCGGK